MVCLWGLSDCTLSEDEDAKYRLKVLENYRKQDSLFILEIQNSYIRVDSSIRAVAQTREELWEVNSVQDAKTRLKNIATLLEADEKHIDSLRLALEKSNSMLAQLQGTGNGLKDKREQLRQQRALVQELQDKLEKVEGENVDLRRLLKESEAKIAAQNTEIQNLSGEVDQKRKEIEELEKRLNEAKDELDQERAAIKKRISTLYYETGVDFYEMAKNTGGIFGKKQRRQEAVQSAYTYLRKALELGNPSAKHKLLSLKEDTKLSKFLTIEQKDFIKSI
jgi:chromosome segregation ATPase